MQKANPYENMFNKFSLSVVLSTCAEKMCCDLTSSMQHIAGEGTHTLYGGSQFTHRNPTYSHNQSLRPFSKPKEIHIFFPMQRKKGPCDKKKFNHMVDDNVKTPTSLVQMHAMNTCPG